MSAREASFQVVAPRGERRDWGGAHGRTKNKASFSNALKDLRDPANTASGRGAGSYQGREWDVAIRGILANIGYLRSRRSNNAALVGDPAGENSHATGYHNAWDEMYDPGQEDPHVWDRRFYGESYLTPVEPHLAASARGGGRGDAGVIDIMTRQRMEDFYGVHAPYGGGGGFTAVRVCE